MPFQPGQSGNPCGRPKGSRNKNSLGVREWATRIVEDPKVQARLLADARTGKLHPSVLTVLMTYAYGRPNFRDVPEPDAHHHRVEHSQATRSDAYGLDGLEKRVVRVRLPPPPPFNSCSVSHLVIDYCLSPTAADCLTRFER